MEVARSLRSLKICALKRTWEAAFRSCSCLKKTQENHHQQFIAEDFRRSHLMIRDIAKFDTTFLKPSISRVSSPPNSGTSRFPTMIDWVSTFKWILEPWKDPWYGGKYHRDPLEASWLEAWRRAEIPGTAEEKAQARGKIRLGNVVGWMLMISWRLRYFQRWVGCKQNCRISCAVVENMWGVVKEWFLTSFANKRNTEKSRRLLLDGLWWLISCCPDRRPSTSGCRNPIFSCQRR